jgi:threonine/homoserine/homoserine lactone efflux protein
MPFLGHNLILRGIIVGVILALPTGPAGFLAIWQTLVNGYRRGLVSAMGLLTTDLIYSTIICFGIGFIEHFLLHYNLLFRFACGVALLGIGFAALRSHKSETKSKAGSHKSAFLETFLLSASNPIILVSSTILFSTFGGPILIAAKFSKILFVTGIVIGGLVWEIFFLKFVDSLNKANKLVSIETINKVCAVIIAATGAFILGVSIIKIGRIVWEYQDFFVQFYRSIGPYLRNYF